LIQILRGDWSNALHSFTELVEFASLPNGLRLNAHIYRGIARYKMGESGLADFRRAFFLNAFDKDAAAFLMLGLLLDYRMNNDVSLLTELEEAISGAKVVFAENDRWFSDLRRVLAELRQ
jgi:hypothetical protein